MIFFLTVVKVELKSWEQGQDLNLRPSGYEPDELPDCSTLLQKIQSTATWTQCNKNFFLARSYPPFSLRSYG